MRRTICVAFERYRRHENRGSRSEPVLDLGISRLPLGNPEPPAIIVDHDIDMIGVVECGRGSREGRVVEVPLGRGEPPDQLREFATVFRIARASALGREIELVPPLQLGLGWKRRSARLLARIR